MTDAWTTAVGPHLSQRSEPIALHEDTLVVGVAHPLTIPILEEMAPTLLARFRELDLPRITRLQFFVSRRIPR